MRSSYASVANKQAPVPWTHAPYASVTVIPPAYSSHQRPPTAVPHVPLMPCTHCGIAALTVAPWEGMPYVWCVCGWAWPLAVAEVPFHDDGEGESSSITPLTTTPEDTPTPETPLSPTVSTQTSERDLEAFLARANLPQLYAPLCHVGMWLPRLRSIALGMLHNDLLDLVPHRAHRQRLIDALHSTVDVRLSHQGKQGVWHRARDQGRTVYICGVSALTDLELREYLGDHHGHVVDMRYMFDPRNNSFMGYGFVMFERKEAVDSILRRTSYAVRQGVTLMVKSGDNIVR